MRCTQRLILSFLLAALAGSLGIPTAAQNGTVSGVVHDPSGAPVAGARVYLQEPDGRHPQTELTDKDGRFFFAMLRPGLFEVRAHGKGMWSPWAHNVEAKGGKQTNITLQLKRKKPSKNAPAKPK